MTIIRYKEHRITWIIKKINLNNLIGMSESNDLQSYNSFLTQKHKQENV